MVSMRRRSSASDALATAEPAQEQRDQRDEAQVAAQAAERSVQRLLVLGDRAQADPLGGEGRLVAIGEALRLAPRAAARRNAS